MNHVERFRAVMRFQPVDRLPMWEWAMWWDKTIERWYGEGLPAELKTVFDIHDYFGLDPYYQVWFSTMQDTIEAAQHHVEGSVASMDDYIAMRPTLYPAHEASIAALTPWAKRQAEGDAVVWMTMEGFYWFPRTLLGLTRHNLAFYEQPELIHAINDDLAAWHLRLLDNIEKVCVPTFMTFAEDMSYNRGPLLSEALFDEFLKPYYDRVIPRVRELGIVPIIDTDGDVTAMVPWLQRVGIDGVLPLERQAHVDAGVLRGQFPSLRMVGHYDKMVMPCGEAAMRAEFERLVPVMRSGGFIPSVDHQTPPGVSLDEYRVYLRLLKEFVAEYHQ